MSLHQIQPRGKTVANWAIDNDIIPDGEMVVESDGGNRVKIGWGSAHYSSLPFTGAVGPAQTEFYADYGGGIDGALTMSSGTLNLSGEYFATIATITGTAIVNCNCNRFFANIALDLSGAGIGAINSNGVAGGNASGATAGTAGTSGTSAALGAGTAGTAGGAGATGAGSQATAPTAITTGNGGSGGQGSAGGSGNVGANAGGALRAGAAVAVTWVPFHRLEYNFLRGATFVLGGCGGAGGGSGGGDGSVSGCGGGGGGGGANTLAIYAKVLIKSATTAAGAIQCRGGNGGHGGGSASGQVGGGGGAGGGGGGYCYLCSEWMAGPVVVDLIDCSGGIGGNGSDGAGTGLGGNGGSSGAGGRIQFFNSRTPSESKSVPAPAPNAVAFYPAIAGSAAFLTLGGAGGYPTATKMSL